jgi:putative transposase
MATLRQRLSTYAITLLAHDRHPHFFTEPHAQLFIETLFRYRTSGKFRLHAFAVMPDHAHVLITPAGDMGTSQCIQLIKGGYSRAARPIWPGTIWHAGYYEHRIRSIGDFIAQSRYIAANPTRRGLCDYSFVHTSYPGQIDTMPAHLHVVNEF